MNSKTGKEKAITKSPSRLFILVVLLIAFLTLANMTIAFAQPKDKVDGSAGSKSPLKKKKQQWRLHLLAARAQEDEGR